jgi:hypothetical protein
MIAPIGAKVKPLGIGWRAEMVCYPDSYPNRLGCQPPKIKYLMLFVFLVGAPGLEPGTR